MKKSPKVLTFDEYADELLAERQPRPLVILAAAKIDEQLKILLTGYLLPKSAGPKSPDELLDGDSALATFSSRIRICHRMGLFDSALHGILHKLRELRNQAAHWVTFGVKDVSLRDQLKSFQQTISSRKSYALIVKRFFDKSVSELDSIEGLQASLLTLSAIITAISDEAIANPLSKIVTTKKVD